MKYHGNGLQRNSQDLLQQKQIAQTKGHWDQLACESTKRNFNERAWGGVASIHLNHNYLTTGDPNYYWVDYLKDKYFKDGNAGNVLSLGCGEGFIERLFKQHGFNFESITGIDLSEKCIEAAKQRALDEKIAPKITYFCANLNEFNLPAKSYNFIFFFHSLHHIESLENILSACANALLPDGLLMINEFVGPSRFQWTDQQLKEANKVFKMLPEYLRYDLQYKVTKQEIVRPSIKEMKTHDPSEAVRSSEIERILKQYFDILEEKNWGGTINNLVFQNTAGNFNLANPYHNTIVDLLIHHENVLIAHNILPSDFKFFMAKPKNSHELPKSDGETRASTTQLSQEQANFNELALQLQAERSKSSELAAQLQLIQTSVSYRVIQKLRSFRWLVAVYRTFRALLKTIYRAFHKEPSPPKPTKTEDNEYVVRCPACDNCTHKPIMKKHGLGYSKCKGCGAVYSNPRLSQKTIDANLESWAKQYRYDAEYLRDRVNFHTDHINIIRQLKPKGKILDFGCGDASFVKAARNLGYNAIGVEKSKFAKEFAQKYYDINEIISGDIENIALPSNSFDMITMWDVLEHLPNPTKICKILANLLSPNGYLVISTPNNHGFSAIIKKENWWVFGPHDHLCLFSIRAAKSFIQNIGLQLDSLVTKDIVPWYPPGYNNKKTFIPNLWDKLSQNTNFLKIITALNLGDWIIVTAKKK